MKHVQMVRTGLELQPKRCAVICNHKTFVVSGHGEASIPIQNSEIRFQYKYS
jgi:hypothetical protein